MHCHLAESAFCMAMHKLAFYILQCEHAEHTPHSSSIQQSENAECTTNSFRPLDASTGVRLQVRNPGTHTHTHAPTNGGIR